MAIINGQKVAISTKSDGTVVNKATGAIISGPKSAPDISSAAARSSASGSSSSSSSSSSTSSGGTSPIITPRPITTPTAPAQANTPEYDAVTGLLTDYGRSQGMPEVNKQNDGPITSPIPDPTTSPRPVYADDPNEPALVEAKTEEDIQGEKMAAAKGEISNLNDYYKTLTNEQQVINDKATRSTDSVSTLTGLSGSSEAGVAANATANTNKASIDKIAQDRAVAVDKILSDIRTSAVEDAKQSRIEARQSLQDRAAYQATAKTNATNSLMTLSKAGSGVTLEGLKKTLTPEEYNTIVKNVGGEEMAKALIFENRPKDTVLGTPQVVGGKMVQAYTLPDGSVKYENVELPAGVTPGNIKSIEKTDNGIFIINNDGTYKRVAGSENTTSGAGDGGVSQELQDAINNGTVDPNKINSRTLGIYNSIAKAGTDAVGSHAGAAGETKAITDLSTYKSTAVRTLGVLESNLPLVENLADKVNTTGVPLLDSYISGKKALATNDPDVIKYVNSLKTLRAEYAQMLAKGNATTESDKAEAAQAIPAGLSSSGYAALGTQLKLEAKNILDASDAAIVAAKSKSASNNGASGSTTLMTGPDGNQYNVPNANVAAFKAAGGY